jgi:hypothetical protein
MVLAKAAAGNCRTCGRLGSGGEIIVPGTASRALTGRAIGLARKLATAVLLATLCLGVSLRPAWAAHKSDQNRDGVVDLQDVILFAEKELGQDWQTVDWCQWIESGDPHIDKKHLADLLAFIAEYFACDAPAIVNANNYPTRLAWASDGRLYVSDALAGSVFVYERLPELTPVAEVQHLAKPLGVALDASGRLYVGVDGRDRVEVYDAGGALIATIGDGTIRMPTWWTARAIRCGSTIRPACCCKASARASFASPWRSRSPEPSSTSRTSATFRSRSSTCRATFCERSGGP